MAMDTVPYFVEVTRAALPLLITKASSTEGDLLIGGENWYFSSESAWRVASAAGFLFGSRARPTEENVASLIGQVIERVEPSGVANLDFRLYLSGGAVLETFSDTALEPWELSLPSVPLIVADGSPA